MIDIFRRNDGIMKSLILPLGHDESSTCWDPVQYPGDATRTDDLQLNHIDLRIGVET